MNGVLWGDIWETPILEDKSFWPQFAQKHEVVVVMYFSVSPRYNRNGCAYLKSFIIIGYC